MAEKAKETKRSRVGYGSAYHQGNIRGGAASNELEAVLGGQTWMITPDKAAKVENPCIWMQAGVVRSKDCGIDYDCPACRFDRAMRHVAADNQRISGEPGTQAPSPCTHTRSAKSGPVIQFRRSCRRMQRLTPPRTTS